MDWKLSKNCPAEINQLSWMIKLWEYALLSTSVRRFPETPVQDIHWSDHLTLGQGYVFLESFQPVGCSEVEIHNFHGD